MSRAEQHEAGSITIKGHSYPVFVDDLGNWTAYHNSNSVEATSKELLRKQLEKLHRAAKVTVAIPFLQVGTSYGRTVSTRYGEATGLHSGNGNVLVRWASGETEQLHRYGGSKILAGDTDGQAWVRLNNESIAAAKALRDFETAHQLDLYSAVRGAVDAQLKGEDENSVE